MKALLMLSVAAALAASAGCGCCNWCRPAGPAVVAAPAPACPPPVAYDPCATPAGVTYGYPPSTGW